MTDQPPKTLGQVAYEAHESGGQQSFGPWEGVSPLVRDVHETMARAVELEVLARLEPTGVDEPVDCGWFVRPAADKIKRLAELEKWCIELVNQRPASPEWDQAMDMIGEIVTEKDSP